MRSTSLAAGFTVFVALALGCSNKPEPVDPNPPLPPLGGPGGPATDEHPELVALANAKGWSLARDTRAPDGKSLMFLKVADREKPFVPTNLSDDDYKVIAKAKSVQMLNLMSVNCSDSGLAILATNPHLLGAIVSGSDVTDAGVKALAGCKSLETVALLNTPKVTDAGLRELATLPTLRHLNVSGDGIDGTGFGALANSKSLVYLRVYSARLGDDGVKALGTLSGLTQLHIGEGLFGRNKVTPAGLKALVSVRVPPVFTFGNRLLDDDLLGALVSKGWLYGPTPPGVLPPRPATAPDVKEIQLNESAVTDKGFAALANCTNVTHLYLNRTGLGDETLKKVAAFQQLEHLELERTAVTPAGLKALAGMPKLKYLSLVSTSADDAAFQELLKLPQLEVLEVDETKVTKGAIEKAKKEHPNRKFRFSRYDL